MNTALTTSGTFNLAETIQLGDILAHSGFFSDSREAAQAVAKIMAGAELGIPPVAAMTGIYIVKGRVTLSANLMAACIKRSGVYTYRVSWPENGCRIEFFERGESIGVSEFGAVEQKRAGLGGDVWSKFPRNMWFARAMSNGAKWYCADVFAGPVYTPDELGEAVTEEGEVIPPAPRLTPLPLEEAPRLTANPPMHRVLTTDPERERKALWQRLELTIAEAKAAGVRVQDAEQLQMDGTASNEEIVAMGKALRAAVDSLPDEDERGAFTEVDDAELWPNGAPA